MNGREPLLITKPHCRRPAATRKACVGGVRPDSGTAPCGHQPHQDGAQRHPRLAQELPLVLSDAEIDVSYLLANSPWIWPRVQSADVVVAYQSGRIATPDGRIRSIRFVPVDP